VDADNGAVGERGQRSQHSQNNERACGVKEEARVVADIADGHGL
jgi:hypothetical protein